MKDKPLPCPFCGEPPRILIKAKKPYKPAYAVRCGNTHCPVMVETFPCHRVTLTPRTEQQAIAVWNKRAPNSSQDIPDASRNNPDGTLP